VLPSLREALGREGALNARGLIKAGVPAAQRTEALRLLEADGFERTTAGVRVPLRQQALDLLKARESVPVRELGRLLRGANATESKALAATLAKEGAARLVLRGKIEVLTTGTADVLTRDELTALSRACKQLSTQSAGALRRAPVTILRDDVSAALLDLVARRERPKVPALSPKPVSLVDTVVKELTRSVRASLGLAFVPDAVRGLNGHGIADTHAALLEADRGGRIELRPESGFNPLTADERALCPPGPQGTRLAWARVIHP
jgi:hypothetical protein